MNELQELDLVVRYLGPVILSLIAVVLFLRAPLRFAVALGLVLLWWRG